MPPPHGGAIFLPMIARMTRFVKQNEEKRVSPVRQAATQNKTAAIIKNIIKMQDLFNVRQ